MVMKFSVSLIVYLSLQALVRNRCVAFQVGCSLTNLGRTDRFHSNVQGVVCGTKSDDYGEEDDAVEPGVMRVSEIKAELDLRAVSYADCFDKESLVQRLTKARREGIADPSILDKFNKQNLERVFRSDSSKDFVSDIADADIEAAIANDGTIPGGLTPDQFKKLIKSPDVMAALSSTKMQEMMRLGMEGKYDEVQKMMQQDSELREMALKIGSVLGT